MADESAHSPSITPGPVWFMTEPHMEPCEEVLRVADAALRSGKNPMLAALAKAGRMNEPNLRP